MRWSWAWLATPVLILLPACPVTVYECDCPDDDSTDDDDAGDDDASGGLTFWSPAFAAGGEIPADYTCDGVDLSPPLSWVGFPAGVESWAVVMTDPDAAGFLHWAIFDIPAETDETAAGMSPGGTLPAGAVELINDFYELGYGGPCPPSLHTYRFTLYALDTPGLGLGEVSTITQLENAIIAAQIEWSSFTGTYGE